METKQPAPGRIVHFVFDEHSAKEAAELGGNPYKEGEIAPAQVVRTWGGSGVNLKVNLDGPGQLWVTSVPEGTGPRTWHWMYEGQANANAPRGVDPSVTSTGN